MSEYSGFAAVLQIEISSVYTTIAQVRDISGPSYSQDAIDVSHRDSRAKKYAAGMYDAGEVTFDIVYDPDSTTHSATATGGVLKELIDGTSKNFKLKFADTTPATATFAAIVTKVEPKAPMNDAQTADVTLKVSGAVTWA